MTARQTLGGLLAVAAVVLGLLGGVSVYLRDQVVDRRSFAERALTALDEPEVHAAIVGEVTAAVRERVPGGLVSDAQIERIVGQVVASPAFRRSFRRRALQANRVLFEAGAPAATLRLGDVLPGFDAIDPRIAALLGASGSQQLLTLRADTLGVGTRRLGDAADRLAGLCPPLALIALVGALLIAPRRRTVLRIAGSGTVLAAALLLALLAIGRSAAVDVVEAGAGVTVAQARDAAGAAWEVYAGDLRPWALGALGAGLLLTALTFVPVGRREPRAD